MIISKTRDVVIIKTGDVYSVAEGRVISTSDGPSIVGDHLRYVATPSGIALLPKYNGVIQRDWAAKYLAQSVVSQFSPELVEFIFGAATDHEALKEACEDATYVSVDVKLDEAINVTRSQAQLVARSNNFINILGDEKAVEDHGDMDCLTQLFRRAIMALEVNPATWSQLLEQWRESLIRVGTPLDEVAAAVNNIPRALGSGLLSRDMFLTGLDILKFHPNVKRFTISLDIEGNGTATETRKVSVPLENYAER